MSIDTQPWTYDGHAVVMLDTAQRGRIAVKLPARWNLCKAAAVDIEALQVGEAARVVGALDADGGVVVCEQATHLLSPAN